MKRWFVVLLLSGCSAVAPSPDSGTPLNDAGVTDAGVTDAGAQEVDAGPTDAGPAEPRFSSSVLYVDEFETYADTAALLAGYPIYREDGGSLALEGSTDGRNQSMRIDYEVRADGGCADADVFVGKLVAGDLPEVIASWRFKLEPGFLYVQPASHCAAQGTGSMELVLMRPSDPSGRITVQVSGEPQVSWRVGIDSASYPQQLRLATHGPLALSQDEWHRVTLAVRRVSGVGMSDGALRMWIDGALVLDVNDAATGTAPFTAIRYPTLLRSGASRAQSRWLDDVTLFAP
jgi:hypothetical protein